MATEEPRRTSRPRDPICPEAEGLADAGKSPADDSYFVRAAVSVCSGAMLVLAVAANAIVRPASGRDHRRDPECRQRSHRKHARVVTKAITRASSRARGTGRKEMSQGRRQ